MGFWLMISLLITGLILLFIGTKKRSNFNTVLKLSGAFCILVSIYLAWPK
ncbi:hypothetical protein P7H75_10620 [Vagococcus carniphilus]|nr:hypothetical protein [Vagococcus carniphilus]MDT2815305.1 hypothetical protein [Vagococcus carniphilus]